MIANLSVYCVTALCAGLQTCILDLPASADAKKGNITFTAPVDSAKSVQVTESLFEARGTQAGFGSLQRVATVNIKVNASNNETLDKPQFRVDWSKAGSTKPDSYYICNDKIESFHDSENSRATPTSSGVWFAPLVELETQLNDYQVHHLHKIVSATFAVRGDKKVPLVASPTGDNSHNESWYNPKTHLLIRRTILISWQGKTIEIKRTEYSGRALNVVLPQSLFLVPPSTAVKKRYF
ncbi:MAG: hypothetical protein ACRYFS_14765 [Janthinobacterium lividum]